jgi:LysR family hydrogen peroxide-inducible transcriptional activator
MEIGQLRSFLRAAELGSFTRAAEALGLSQPAVSQQIGRLEEELGCPVFERLGRRVALTEAGRKLRERAEQIVVLVDDTAGEVRDDGETGRLVVAAIPTIAPFLLPRALTAFREARPLARVEVNEETTEELVKACQRGEVDVGVLALPVETRYLETEPLFDEELYLVMPAGHALAGREEVSLDLVKPEPFVMLEEAHCLSGHIRSFCERRKFQPIATGRTSQLATVQELVALGHGLSFIPEMARGFDQGGRRVYASVAGKRPMRTIAACWNPYRYQSRLAGAFLEILRGMKTGRV